MNKKLLLTVFALALTIVMVFGQNKGSSGTKTEVWDFGAMQLDTAMYINMLDSATINSWYPGTVTPGTSGNVLPASFTVGKLSWTGGTNDRLRTTNLSLSRYDQNIASVIGYTGRVYVNSAAATGRFMSFTLGEDDELKIIEKTDAGGKLNFIYVDDPAAQTDVVTVTSNLDSLTFVAKAAGTYKIYDNVGKPSYFRFYRKDATYVTIKGSVDLTNAAGIPDGFGINFTNAAGKTWNSVVGADTFDITVPAGYIYSLSISDANGYIVSNGKTLNVTEATTSYMVDILKADLYNVTGNITGLDAAHLAALQLNYSADTALHKIYVPEPTVDALAGTYSVQLEPNCNYTISAIGVNDFYITDDTIRILTADAVKDITFAAKPVYNVDITTTGLTVDQVALLSLTFTNLNEEGYMYSFAPGAPITLRDGTYQVSYSGLDEYPMQMSLTSNLVVKGADITKNLEFGPQKKWSFDDKVITNGDVNYEGLTFTGTVSNEIAKGHLVTKPGASILVPIDPGDKIKITYYFSASFRVNSGDTVSTNSGSTSLFEYVEYMFSGVDAGFDTINILSDAGTTYLPEIEVIPTVAYKDTVYVGSDKEYKTINEALTAVSRMTRNSTERVVVVIDPGNYEEMLVVDMPNITLKNASATPSTSLTNKGVGIDVNAVRITSYYGHGYSYFSMGNNQKWNADLLAVNKENGYLSYQNVGAGTTNGSYWNSTVLVSGSGFEADDIIFENSFNQYISRKESEDVVVMWEVGNKGERPTTEGSTAVQDRSFVERAAALAIANNTDKVVLNNCRIVGRQDAFYGGTGARVVVNHGAVMGAVDYIFGGMTVVFYKTDLVMNTSDASVDAAYITAPQQTSGRGFLMYKCHVTSAVPGSETASQSKTKPGYFGRPWQANTSEVVYYFTLIDTCEFPGSEGASLVSPQGWMNTLGGESNMMYEYGTMEINGHDYSGDRASWSTVLTEPQLSDGAAITTFNFTKGSDDWNPIPFEQDILSASKDTLKMDQYPSFEQTVFNISSDISWSISADKDWISVDPEKGIIDQTIFVSVTPNTEIGSRQGIITITGKTGISTQVAIVQKGLVPELNVSSTGLNIMAAANSTVNFDVTSNINWTINSSESWLTPNVMNGSGNLTITLTAEENPAATTRNATITVTGSGVTKTINVVQDAGTSGISSGKKQPVILYPNPVRDDLSLLNIPANAVISIMDLNGKVLKVKTSGGTHEVIQMSELDNGVYLVKVSNENGVIIRRCVKE